MKIGIVCYPTYGGSGIVATELGKALADKGHEVHFISYSQPVRLDVFSEKMFYHEVSVSDYPLFEYTQMVLLNQQMVYYQGHVYPFFPPILYVQYFPDFCKTSLISL